MNSPTAAGALLSFSRYGDCAPFLMEFVLVGFGSRCDWVHPVRPARTKHLASRRHHAMLRVLAFSTVYVPILARCSSR